MEIQKISTYSAYERHTGAKHIMEVYKKDVGAPYYISLNGSFMADAETEREAVDEILDTIKWFGWSRTNPNYA